MYRRILLVSMTTIISGAVWAACDASVPSDPTDAGASDDAISAIDSRSKTDAAIADGSVIPQPDAGPSDSAIPVDAGDSASSIDAGDASTSTDAATAPDTAPFDAAVPPPETLADIPNLGSFDFEGDTLAYRLAVAGPSEVYTCTMPGCAASTALPSVMATHHTVASGKVFYTGPGPSAVNKAALHSIHLDGTGAAVVTDDAAYTGRIQVTNMFGGLARQVADTTRTPLVGVAGTGVMETNVGRISSLPAASTHLHEVGDQSIRGSWPDLLMGTGTLPTLRNQGGCIGNCLVGSMATTPRTSEGVPLANPYVAVVVMSSLSSNIVVCDMKTTNCTGWNFIGRGFSVNLDAKYLYIAGFLDGTAGTKRGIGRCTLAELSTLGTCTLAPIAEELATGPIYLIPGLNPTHVIYRSGTRVRRATLSP